LQFAVLKQLPIIYLVQDNQWSISASAYEIRTCNAYEYAAGFKGLKRLQCDGSDFIRSYETMEQAMDYARQNETGIGACESAFAGSSYQRRKKRILP
jgi:2-oxoisovalerate dehydrogenase E1 component